MHRPAAESVRRAANEILDASQHCIDRGQINAALILLYSGIDQMGWLARPQGKPKSDRRDFIRWVDRYLLPATGINCDAVDLYAARCGILHSQSAQALLTEQGDATEIWYSWGGQVPEDLMDLYHFVAHEEDPPHAIHLDELRRAFHEGVQRFLAAAEADPDLADCLRDRSRKILANLSVD